MPSRPAARPSSCRSAAPSRAARTWRSASTMCAPMSSPAGSPRRSAIPWSRRSWPMCPKAASRHRASTCVSRARSRSPSEAFKGVLEGAARSFRQAGFRAHRADRRSRRLPVAVAGGGGEARTASGRARRRACTSSPSTTAHADAPTCRPCAQRGLSEAADRQPCRRRRHLADDGRSIRAWCAPTGLAAAPVAGDGTAGDPRPSRRPSGSSASTRSLLEASPRFAPPSADNRRFPIPDDGMRKMIRLGLLAGLFATLASTTWWVTAQTAGTPRSTPAPGPIVDGAGHAAGHRSDQPLQRDRPRPSLRPARQATCRASTCRTGAATRSR